MPSTRLSSHSSSSSPSSPTLPSPHNSPSATVKSEHLDRHAQLPQQQQQQLPSQAGKKKHQCQHCERSFTTSGHLARHSRVHTGERNHKCPFPGCETKCSRQDNLQQHYRIHLAPGSRRASTKTSSSRRTSRQNSTTEITPVILTPATTSSRAGGAGATGALSASPTSASFDDSAYPPPPPPDQPPALEEATPEGLQRGRGIGARAIITPPASFHQAAQPSTSSTTSNDFSPYSGRAYNAAPSSYQQDSYSPPSSSHSRSHNHESVGGKQQQPSTSSPAPSNHSAHSNASSKRLSISDLSHPTAYSGPSYQYSQPYPGASYPGADSAYPTPSASTYDVSPQSYSPVAPYSHPSFVDGAARRAHDYDRDYNATHQGQQGHDYYHHHQQHQQQQSSYTQPTYERPTVYREGSSYTATSAYSAESSRTEYLHSAGAYPHHHHQHHHQLPPVDFTSRTSAIF